MAKKKISSLSDVKKYANAVSADSVLNDMINTLALHGERIIKLAYETKTFKDRTFNLRDSYVSAVFYNGRLQKGTVSFVGDPKSETPVEYEPYASGDTEFRTGREEAELFLSKFSFSSGRPGGLVLVVAAVMFYSGMVEGRDYYVISQITDELEELAANGFNTLKYKAHIDEEYIDEPSVYREGGSGRMHIINP
jgi:hypothetical protein